MTDTKMIKSIDLTVPTGKRILSGKEVGINLRDQYKLDDLDNQNGFVEVNISVPVVTSSFILGMFSKSMKKLGIENFFEKYHFNARDDIIRNIEVNAKYSNTEGTALN